MANKNLWQVHLADSESMDRIGEITDECRGKQLKISMNKAGGFGFNIPMSTDFYQYLNPSYNCIIVSKNKHVVWSGPIWTKEENFTTGKIQIDAVGWFQNLHKRYLLDADHVYADWNDGAIAANLVLYANSQSAYGTHRSTYIWPGTNTSERVLTTTIPRWANVGEEIEKLTQSENGFDFLIDPVTRLLNIYSWAEYQENGLVFAAQWGPDNATDVVRTSSADEMGNDYYVVGPNSTAHMSDQTSIDTYGLHQKVININEADNSDILPVIAGAELAVNKDPRVLIQFTPRPPGEENEFPSVFEDFNIRDKVFLTAKRDNAVIDNLAVRIWGFTVDINENNIERVSTMQTTYQQGAG